MIKKTLTIGLLVLSLVGCNNAEESIIDNPVNVSDQTTEVVTVDSEPVQVESVTSETGYAYEITNVDGNNINGVALNHKTADNSGIYLTADMVPFSVNEGDKIIIEFGQYGDDIKSIEKVESDTIENETIAEQFVITSVENGIIRGELLNETGEGIYYNLNELDSKLYDVFSQLDVNDIVRLEWTTDNYNDGEWLDIESVTFNKEGNKQS